MWYRGFETLPEDKLCPEVDRILAILNVNRIVTGHNLQVSIIVFTTKCSFPLVCLLCWLNLAEIIY